MPSEVRHVLFKPAEVAEAVVAYLRLRQVPLPRGTIMSCGVADTPPGAPVLFRIIVAPDAAPAATTGAGRRVEVTCAGQDLAAALMMYCRKRRVPLPMKARKSLERFGPRLALVLALGEDADAERLRLGGRGAATPAAAPTPAKA